MRDLGLTRRNLLIGGGAGVGLLLAWGLWPRRYAPNLNAAPGETIIDAFLKIGIDGRIVAIVQQAEMGQGVYTSLPQILADELGADWRTVSVEPAPINPLYANSLLISEALDDALPKFLEGVGHWAAREIGLRMNTTLTGGSSSIRGLEQRFRESGALARQLLCMAAAKRWQADWQACETRDGFVIRGEDRLRFSELVTEAARLTPDGPIMLRPVGEGGLSGRSVPRLDLPSKVDGTAAFGADIRLPEMVYASVRHGPYGSGALEQTTPADADAIPGVMAIVTHPGWVAAVASNWWAADRAAEALAARFGTKGALPDSRSIDRALRSALDGDGGAEYGGHGDIDTALASGNIIRATYTAPMLPHAPMETLTATARITGDRIEIWVPTQSAPVVRAVVARALNIAETQITIYPTLVGGGFGRKVEADAALQAVIIARKMKKPVQLVWSRSEDLHLGRFRPPAIGRLTARLESGGRIAGWRAEIAAPSTTAQMMARLMGGSSDGTSPEAGAVEGASPPYVTGALAITHKPADIGVGTGAWRSVANSYTAFFTESFIDELAAKAGLDPLSFRIQSLVGQPRLARCLATVTAMGDWQGGVAGSAQGIALHSCFGSHVAMLVEVDVTDTQKIRVTHVTAVVDCGRVIHPDIVRQQIEGGILWGLGGALGTGISLTGGKVDQTNFDALGLPLLVDTPEIRVEILPSKEAPGGVGEISVPPVAPAIANAIFAATGQRLRNLPLRLNEA